MATSTVHPIAPAWSNSIAQKPPSLSSSSQPFLLAPSGLKRAALREGLRRQLRLRRPACPAAHLNDSKNSEDAVAADPSTLDRRQLLLRSGSVALGVAGAPGASLWLPQSARGSPVEPPDLSQCNTPIDPGNGAPTVSCCLPVSDTITDFTFPTSLPMRTRCSAYTVSSDYITKYKKAYALLRDLPSTDPRAFAQQSNVHCAFCDAAYDETGTSLEYQVHNSWFFFPWHRWYLYFHERILASVIDDDSFALPFWNWDTQTGFTMPAMFLDESSSLYDSNRNPSHLPPSPVDLSYDETVENRTVAAQLQVNNATMYRQIVSGAKTPSLFFGSAYRQGDSPSPGPGTVENSPHGTVHTWTGNPANPNDENMGALYSAGRDPIFYSHHSNVDRLWEVWKSLGGRRKDLSDADYLNATFKFYDEKANLVRVKISDALDITKLRYKYEDVVNAWIVPSTTTTVSSTATAMSFGVGGGPALAAGGFGGLSLPNVGGLSLPNVGSGRPPPPAGELKVLKEKFKKFKGGLKEFKERGSNKLDNKISILVKRPKIVKADDEEEEILVLEGVKVASDERIKFDVFINLVGDDDKAGSDAREYAGSFVNLPHMGMKMENDKGPRYKKSNFRIGVGEVLKELGIEDDDDFAITLVPRGSPSVPVTIEKVRIEYE